VISDPEPYARAYASWAAGDARWQALSVPTGDFYPWSAASPYVKRPPYVTGISRHPAPPRDIIGARALLVLGDSVTTDHISPAGAIAPDSPAGEYLRSLGVPPREFNSYGARRTNHEVLLRGAFANPQLRNQLVPGSTGGYTIDQLVDQRTTVYQAALAYQAAGVPLVVLAGREYGTGSSRDWAAKGPALLGVRAVIARSFERIHRSNLVGMGILPLEFPPGESAGSLGMSGRDPIDITGVEELRDTMPATVQVTAGPARFRAVVRIDSPREAEYFRHGGILAHALRGLLSPHG
jgi:aconitate hydratase